MGGHIKIYSILKKSFIYWFRFWNVQSIDSICCVISMYPSFYFLSFSKITIKGHKHWGKMNFFQSFLLNGKSTLFSSYWYALYYIIFVQKIKKKIFYIYLCPYSAFVLCWIDENTNFLSPNFASRLDPPNLWGIVIIFV